MKNIQQFGNFLAKNFFFLLKDDIKKHKKSIKKLKHLSYWSPPSKKTEQKIPCKKDEHKTQGSFLLFLAMIRKVCKTHILLIISLFTNLLRPILLLSVSTCQSVAAVVLYILVTKKKFDCNCSFIPPCAYLLN